MEPEATHQKWTTESWLTVEDVGVVVQEAGCEVAGYAAQYDLHDIMNLAHFERLHWRLQSIEEEHRQQAVETQLAKTRGFSESLSEHFAGHSHMDGGAFISLAWLKQAVENAAADNEILKQQRKAAETRLLLKNKK